MTDTMAATALTAISRPPTGAKTLNTFPAGPARPIGFRSGGLPVKITGSSALPAAQQASPTPAAQPTGRQRGEGRVPVGNRSTASTASPRPTSQIQPNQSDIVEIPV